MSWHRRVAETIDQALIALRYTDHWETNATVYERTVDADANPFPVFRLWRWWP